MRIKFYFHAIFLLLAMKSFAGEIIQTKEFFIQDIEFRKADYYDVVDYKGIPASTLIGKPRLPRLIQTVLIPSGSLTTGVEIIDIDEIELSGDFNIAPSQKAVPLPMPGKTFPIERTIPDPQIYNNDKFYPDKNIKAISTGTMCGYSLAHVEIYPVRYNPITKKISLIKKITFKLKYDENILPGNVSTNYQREIFGKVVGALVNNSDKVDLYAPKVSTPKISKALPSGEYKYVTISGKAEFDTIFARLAAWKTMKGIRDTVISINWISANYTGYDLAEKVRNFIIDAKNTWGAVYVLLGGQGDDLNVSEDLIPFRHAYYVMVNGGHTDYIPSDLYYSDLDGSWDESNNNIYGELGDNVNLYPDVFVGRAPVKTIAQAQNFIKKVLTYEKNPPTDYLKKMLLPTAILWSSYEERPVQRVIANMTYSGWTDDSLFERNGTLSNSVMINSMNNGRGMGNWVGHGNENGIYYSSGAYYSSSDADAASNGDKQGIAISCACMTGGVDLVSGGDCFAEHIINRTDGGCAGVMMNSRYGWGAYISGVGYVVGPSEMIDTTFFHGIFNNGLSRQGQALAAAKSTWIPYADSFNQYDMMRWCLYELNLFGDPEMMLWTDVPGNMQVTHDPIIVVGSANYSVTVKDQATNNPIGQALVCLMTGSGDCYVYGTTDAAGSVVLTPSPANVGDSMMITVTKQNYTPYQCSASVITLSGPYVVYNAFQIDDDGTGSSTGNNDGTVDPGETIEFGVSVKNVGQDTAKTVSATLRTSDSYVVISDSVVSYGDVSPDSVMTSGNFLWSVDVSCPNNQSILFSLAVSDGDTTWNSFFSASVPEPVLKVASHSIDDDNSGSSSGNGDGVVNRGELIEIRPLLANIGTVLSPNATAIMRTFDPYMTILDSTADYGDIASGDTINCLSPLVFTVSTSAPREYWATLYFEISDDNPNAKSWQDSIRIRVWDIGQVMLVAKESSWTSYFAVALDSLGYSYDSFSACSDTSILNRYWTIILSTGITGTITSTEQAALAQYLDRGGRLFATGQDIGFSIGGTSFYDNYLHAIYNIDDPYVRTLTGTTTDLIGDSLTLSILGGDGANNQRYPDGITPTAGGTSVFSYDGTPYKGGVRYENEYKTVYFSFGYEAISTWNNRKLVMKRILQWFKGGPLITNVTVLPQYQSPLGSVNIRARATDLDTVFSVMVHIESPDETMVDSLYLYDDGAHNDGASGDNVYGNDWITLAIPQKYFIDVTGVDKVGDTTYVNNGAWFSTNSPPVIEVSPDSIGVSLFVNDSTTCLLKIKNTGGDTLYFDISEQQRTLFKSIFSKDVRPSDNKSIIKKENTECLIESTKYPGDSDIKASKNEKPFFWGTAEKAIKAQRPFSLLTSPPIAGTYSGTHLSFGLSDYGEIIPFQYPVGNEHLAQGVWLSGYTVCYNDGVDYVKYSGYEYRNGIVPVSYIVTQNDTNKTVVEVTTRTNDDKLQITQRFTFDKQDKYVQIRPIIKNISGGQLDQVDFKLWADWDVDNNPTDDTWGYDSTVHMIWANTIHWVSLAGSTVPAFRDIDNWPGDDYNRRLTDQDNPNGPLYGDGICVVHYQMGTLGIGAEASLFLVYAAADSLAELKEVVERGLGDIPWLSELPVSGTVSENDSLAVAVKFSAVGLAANTTYKGWLLIQSDDTITPQITLPVVLTTNPTGVEGEPDMPLLPRVFALHQCFPNPFSRQTTIKYQIPAAGMNKASSINLQSGQITVRCRIDIYNIAGQLVKKLVDENVGPGYYQTIWDGRDNSGRKVSSGVYFYRIQAGEFMDTKKLTLMR